MLSHSLFSSESSSSRLFPLIGQIRVRWGLGGEAQPGSRALGQNRLLEPSMMYATAREIRINTEPEPPVSTGWAPGTAWAVLNAGQNTRY